MAVGAMRTRRAASRSPHDGASGRPPRPQRLMARPARELPRPLEESGWPGGWDVGVEVKDVAGVVLRFDRCQAVVLAWPVGGAHAVFLVFGHEVHIAPDSAGVRHQG